MSAVRCESISEIDIFGAEITDCIQCHAVGVVMDVRRAQPRCGVVL